MQADRASSAGVSAASAIEDRRPVVDLASKSSPGAAGSGRARWSRGGPGPSAIRPNGTGSAAPAAIALELAGQYPIISATWARTSGGPQPPRARRRTARPAATAPGLDRRADGRRGGRGPPRWRSVTGSSAMAAVWHDGRSMGGHISGRRGARRRSQHGRRAMTETLSKGAANQAGARIDADAYAKAADFLPLNGIDHVEFWVGNARQAAAYYRALWGFTPVAFSGLETKVRDRAELRHGPERHPVRVHGAADARWRDRRARPGARRRRPRHRLRGRRRRVGLARDDVAWRALGARADRARRRRGRHPPQGLDPHLRRGPPLVRRPARLPRASSRPAIGRSSRRRARPAGCRCSRSTTASATSGSARWTGSSTSTATSSGSPSSSTTTTRSSTPTTAR